jgi:hypothetical protein
MAITAQEVESTGIEIVQNADNMTRQIFCLHMTHRHGDSLGGMSELNPLVQNDYTEELWRTFHDKLHSGVLTPDPFHPPTHEHEQDDS